jgi:RNA polymerase sigma-70 factor (sigma-E family)
MMIGPVGLDRPIRDNLDPLARLFDAHYATMLRLATLLLDDIGTAEEVVQDAYVRLHGRSLDFDDNERAGSYLRSTVLNLARSRLRRRRLARSHLRATREVAASPEDVVLVRADQQEVLNALRSLSPRQRECLVLRYYLDLSEAEIAATLAISAGSVKTHTARGMAALADRLEGLQ